MDKNTGKDFNEFVTKLSQTMGNSLQAVIHVKRPSSGIPYFKKDEALIIIVDRIHPNLLSWLLNWTKNVLGYEEIDFDFLIFSLSDLHRFITKTFSPPAIHILKTGTCLYGKDVLQPLFHLVQSGRVATDFVIKQETSNLITTLERLEILLIQTLHEIEERLKEYEDIISRGAEVTYDDLFDAFYGANLPLKEPPKLGSISADDIGKMMQSCKQKITELRNRAKDL